jgi:hypothetical protein
MLTSGKSDREIAPDHTVGLRVAECFVGEPPLGNQTKHIVCDGFSCGKQQVKEKLSRLSLTPFFRAQKSPSARKRLSSSADGLMCRMIALGVIAAIVIEGLRSDLDPLVTGDGLMQGMIEPIPDNLLSLDNTFCSSFERSWQ